MVKLNIKPLSINKCWQGKRFKTKDYSVYERSVLLLLPKINLPNKPFKICFEFGLSNSCNDIDNSLKPILDILVKKYGFDDRDVYECNLKKTIVKKGFEFINFDISSIEL